MSTIHAGYITTSFIPGPFPWQWTNGGFDLNNFLQALQTVLQQQWFFMS
jgi:hypothetical protein